MVESHCITAGQRRPKGSQALTGPTSTPGSNLSTCLRRTRGSPRQNATRRSLRTWILHQLLDMIHIPRTAMPKGY